ncbi:MAG: membrane protein insertion efficiency factor YidD [Planctomycetes bacterium]|nr:membrane protein insertion efficiency factor YidD [Planctomycetota bacterium]
MAGLLVLVIRAYQAGIRPFLVGTCKFHPTCSEYAIEALRRHGPLRGTVLACGRVLRCHPLTAGGIDLVPEPHPTPGSGADMARRTP